MTFQKYISNTTCSFRVRHKRFIQSKQLRFQESHIYSRKKCFQTIMQCSIVHCGQMGRSLVHFTIFRVNKRHRCMQAVMSTMESREHRKLDQIIVFIFNPSVEEHEMFHITQNKLPQFCPKTAEYEMFKTTSHAN